MKEEENLEWNGHHKKTKYEGGWSEKEKNREIPAQIHESHVENANQCQSWVLSSVSHGPSEIIPICWFAAQETSILKPWYFKKKIWLVKLK